MSDPLSRTFVALAEPTQRSILAEIANGALTVNASVAANGLSQPGRSKHPRVLEEAGLIRRERVAKTRPVHLDAAGLKLAAAWLDQYRTHWERVFDRMDALIARLNEEAEKTGRQ